MNLEELTGEVERLRDRQEILDCLNRYCRAVDRLDRDLLLGCYHEDAIDDHAIFLGNREEFADWVMELHGRHQTATLHHITNHSCDLDGDVAHAETYYIFAGMNRAGVPLTVCGGRYVDRFERRDGRWAIVARRSLIEWQGTPGEVFIRREPTGADPGRAEVARDQSDPSYQRPLAVKAGAAAYRIAAYTTQPSGE